MISNSLRGLFCLFCFIVMMSLPLSAVDDDLDLFRLRANAFIEHDWTELDIEAEIVFGRKLAARILGQYPMYDNEKLQRYINLLGQGLVSMVGRSEINYYFLVVNSDHVNAYATPGGYVFVTKGLIKQCRDEAQLIGVLAHEISHINRRYIVSKFNIRGNQSSLLSDAGILVGGSSQTTRLTLNVVLSQVMDLLLSDGLDKEEELLADQDAVFYMSLLNYDWLQYAELIVTLAADSDVKSVSHTHPSSDERVGGVRSYVSENDLTGRFRRQQRFRNYVHI